MSYYVISVGRCQKEKENRMSKATPTFLNVDEGHALIGKDKISRRSLYSALEREEIPSVRIGKKILIPQYAFMTWLREHGAIPQ
jgi:excisionase family DNA binding protein